MNDYAVDYICPVSTYSDYIVQLANELETKGLDFSVCPMSQSTLFQYHRKLNDKHIIDGYFDHTPESPFDELLSKYGITSSRSFVFPTMVYDRTYPHRNYNRFISPHSCPVNFEPYLEELHRSLDYFDQLYSDGFHPVHISNQGAKIIRQVIQAVSDYHGIQSIRYSFNPLPGRRSIRSSNEMRFPELAESLEKPLTNDERKRAQEYVDTIRGQKPLYSGGPPNEETDVLENFSDNLNKLINYNGNRIKAVTQKLSRTSLKATSKRVQSFWHTNESQVEGILSTGNYAYYPLQYSRESRVTLRAQPYYDQVALIQFLSRNLPSGADYLIVKDHPNHIGQLSLQGVRSLASHAYFVNPRMSSHDLIENAAAIVTLNNTVGHEALVWQKPVVTLGGALYNGLGITYDVDNLADISDTVATAIAEGGPTEKELLRYINGLHAVGDKVIWGYSSDDNIENAVQSILKRST